MSNQIRFIKLSLVLLFFLVGIGALLGSVYLIFLTAFGIGWGGGETTILELMWTWKGFVLITIYAFIAAFGLFKHKKFGVIFGYTIAFLFLLYPVFDQGIFGGSKEHSTSFIDLIWIMLYLGLPIATIYGLTMIKKTLKPFQLLDYMLLVALVLSLYVSFYEIFTP